jgi:hypothetical protein
MFLWGIPLDYNFPTPPRNFLGRVGFFLPFSECFWYNGKIRVMSFLLR